MMKRKWTWTAKYNDGSIIEQPPEPAAFLGDLDIAKVSLFEVKNGKKSFSTDTSTKHFFEGSNYIASPELNDQGQEFFCFKRVTVHQDGGIEEKIIFGFRGSRISKEIIISENGDWVINLERSD